MMENVSDLNSHREYLFSYLKKKNPSGRFDDFEDAIQACFIKATRYIDSFKGDCSLRSWLSMIAINCYTDIFRKRYKVHERLIESDDDYVFENQSSEDFSESICNEDYFKKLSKDLFYDIDSNIYMQTFKLNAIDDLQYNEISEELNIPLGTVKSRIFKAKKILQQRYNQSLESNKI